MFNYQTIQKHTQLKSGVKEITSKNYIACFKRLNKDLGITSFDYYKTNSKKVIKYIINMENKSSAKTIFNSVGTF